MKASARVLPSPLLFLLLTLVTAPSAEAQYSYDFESNYGLIDLFEHAENDSLTVQSYGFFTVGMPLGKSKFVYEFQRPLTAGVKFENRDENGYVSATWLAAGCVLGVTAWTMVALGYDYEQIDRWAKYAMVPFGSHIGYRLNRWLTLYGGMIPEVLLFTESDGVIAQVRAGVRADLKMGLAVKVGIQKARYWGWEKPSRTFPAGFHIGITYAPTHGGPLLL